MAKRSHHLMTVLSQMIIGEIVRKARPNKQRSGLIACTNLAAAPHTQPQSACCVKQLRLCQWWQGLERGFFHEYTSSLEAYRDKPFKTEI